MPFKAIIFDLDGTLLNTLEDLANATNRVLNKKGFPAHPLDAYRYFVGDGSKMLITRALPEDKRHEDMIRVCFKMLLEDYGRNWKIDTKPYEGITEMLDALSARGLNMSILSNKPHEFTKICVAEFLGKWNFDIVLGQRDKFPRKPDPAGAIKIARQMNMDPRDFLYLGDTAIDMKTAIAAGMFPVGALWGFRPLKELKESGAEALIERPMEILNLLNMKPYKVLFIGNSHTYFNDMPRSVVKLAEAAGQERNLEVEQSTGNAVSLEWHWENPKTRDLIKSERWDYVVLQDRSGGPLEARESMHHHARLLDSEIKKQGAKTIFYMTWALKHNPETQKTITEAYEQIAQELDAILAPVGMVWKKCQKVDPGLNLYYKDGNHANPLGSYLTACVFYATIYHVSPEGLPCPISLENDEFSSLTEDKIRFLQRMAFEATLFSRS